MAVPRPSLTGRLVNVYSTRDWFLGLLCKAAYLRVGGTAGLQRVAGVPGLENVDVSHLVQDHLDYWYRMDDILQVWAIISSCRQFLLCLFCVFFLCSNGFYVNPLSHTHLRLLSCVQ